LSRRGLWVVGGLVGWLEFGVWTEGEVPGREEGGGLTGWCVDAGQVKWRGNFGYLPIAHPATFR